MVTVSWPGLLMVCLAVALPAMGIGGLLVYVLEEIHIGHICDRESGAAETDYVGPTHSRSSHGGTPE